MPSINSQYHVSVHNDTSGSNFINDCVKVQTAVEHGLR